MRRYPLFFGTILFFGCPQNPAGNLCGNTVLDANETCDDGNNISGDGCSATCEFEDPCGNGTLEGNEQCDDGNNTPGDGCDALCQNEPCGNGIVEAPEQCDDGNNTNGDGCSSSCSLEPVCGNNLLEAGEQCDDGNLANGDGCSSLCQDEPLIALCGDGFITDSEECDDGNFLSTDGCSSLCVTENIAPPVCNTPEVKNGYIKTTCQYERLHVAGTIALDVYTPITAITDAPVLFFIHGGGWSSGSRGEAEAGLSSFAQQGVIGVSIDYELRPAPQIGVPNDLIDSIAEMNFQRDAAAAFAWAKQNIASFGGDPNNIVLSGHSAGGHMATLLTAQKSWVIDAFLLGGLLDASQTADFKVSSIVTGLIDLSGPIDLASQNNFGDLAGFLITNVWSQAMLVEGSPLHHFGIEQDAPPMIHTVGGGLGLIADPEAIIGSHIDYVNLAHSLDINATFIQPVFESVSFGFQFPFQDFNGATCFSLMQHGDTAILLGQDFVQLALNQGLFESRPDTCNAQSLLGVFVGAPGYRDVLLNFVLDPSAPTNWSTPGFSNRSIPNVIPSPLLIGAGSGVLPTDTEHWSANPRTNPQHGFVFVSNQTIDTTGVTTSAGDPLPEGIFDFQLAAGGTGILEVHAPVPPGEYRVRLYFAELFTQRFVDVTAEGVVLGTNLSTFDGAVNKAKIIELATPVTVDASFDLILQQTTGTNQRPMLSGVELIPN